jgi:hypothetical protein
MADFWFADVVDLEHSYARAIVDGRELIEAFPGASDSFQEFHVYLQAVAWLRLLVSVPGTTCGLASLIDR